MLLPICLHDMLDPDPIPKQTPYIRILFLQPINDGCDFAVGGTLDSSEAMMHGRADM